MNDNPTPGPELKAPVPDGDHARAASAAAVTVCGATNVGCVRSHNEDAFTIADLSSDSTVGPGEGKRFPLANNGVLLMVCDGMGGHAAGEVVSLPLVLKAEIEGEMDDPHMGLQARLMSQALRHLRGFHQPDSRLQRRRSQRGRGLRNQ